MESAKDHTEGLHLVGAAKVRTHLCVLTQLTSIIIGVGHREIIIADALQNVNLSAKFMICPP